MKKPYQIEAQRAIKQLDAMAADGNLAVQMMLPMAEMMGWLRKDVGELIRQAGLQLSLRDQEPGSHPSLSLVTTVPAFHVLTNLLDNRECRLDDVGARHGFAQLRGHVQAMNS